MSHDEVGSGELESAERGREWIWLEMLAVAGQMFGPGLHKVWPKYAMASGWQKCFLIMPMCVRADCVCPRVCALVLSLERTRLSASGFCGSGPC